MQEHIFFLKHARELRQNLSDGLLLMDLYSYTKDGVFSLET
jgi:hypothetical protein